MIQTVVILTCMGILSVQDIRSRKVSVWLIAVLAAAGAVFLITGTAGMTGTAGQTEAAEEKLIWGQSLAGVLPGVILWAAGKFLKGQIGTGDGFTVAALGIHTGIWKIVNCLLYGSVFCALAGLTLLLAKKKRGKDTLPFLPFLTAGYVAVLLL